MRRFVLAFCCGIVFSIVGTVPALQAERPKGIGADYKPAKVHREKPHHQKPTAIYSVPRSARWWNGGGPGPAGAGAR